MENLRENLISSFSDGKNPSGSQFKLLIESIMSRRDDGMDKSADSALKVMAGKENHAPVLHLCPKGVLDPQWVVSLKALDSLGNFVREGLNIGQGDTPSNPVVFLDKSTGNVGLGTNAPASQLEVHDDVNGDVSITVDNDSTGTNAFSALHLRTETSDGDVIKNSATRLAEGGPNAMTVRNQTGDLRLLSQSGGALVSLKATGQVGVNTESPSMPIELNGHVGLAGNSLYFPLSTATVAALGETGLFWGGKDSGTATTYGIYRTAGTWTGNFQQMRINFDTGIQLGAGTGVGAGFAKSFVEVVSGKGLMVTSGNLGVNTTTPVAKAQVVTTAFDGDAALPATWGAGQMVVGGANNDGGLALAYSGTKETSYLISGKPGVGFQDLGIKARTLTFANSTGESMRLTSDGKLGIGTVSPSGMLHVRKDQNGMTQTVLQNSSATADASVALQLTTDAGSAVLMKNSSLRAGNEGVNTLVLRNDKGDVRVQPEAGFGIYLRAVTGAVGIGTSNPAQYVHVRKDANAINAMLYQNATAGTDAYVAYNFQTDNGTATLFKNSSLRTADGGANTLTLRNDNGDLRLQTQTGSGITVAGSTGNVGIGTAPTTSLMHLRKDQNQITNVTLQNAQAGTDAFISQVLSTDNSSGSLFKNSSLRTTDGGANTMTLRNELGDLRLLAQGSVGISVAATSGNVGIGTAPSSYHLHLRKDQNAHTTLAVQNGTAGTDSYVNSVLQTDNSAGRLYKNSSLRTIEGGANTMTLQNDRGDLRLLAEGQKGMLVRAATGFVGLNTSNPNYLLQLNGGHLSIAASEDTALQSGTGHANLGTIHFYGHARSLTNNSASITCGSTGWDSSGYLSFATSATNGMAIEAMRLDEMGKMGIGVSTPLTKLHIESIGRNIYGNGVLIGKTNEPVRTGANPGDIISTTDIGFTGYRDTVPNQVGAKISAIRIATHATGVAERIQASELAFYTGDGGAALAADTSFVDTSVERLRITRDGKVGIGTTGPNFFIHNYRAENAGVYNVTQNPSNGTSAFTFIGLKSDATDGFMTLNSSTRPDEGGPNCMTVRNDGGDLRLQAKGSLGLQVKANTGWVGLGTPDPKGKLDITGGPLMMQVSFGNSAARPAVGTARIAEEISSYSTMGPAGDDGFLRLSAGGGTNANTKSYIDISGYSGVADMQRNILFGTAGAERVRIDQNGRMGIGTSTPRCPLDVKGSVLTTLTPYAYLVYPQITGTSSGNSGVSIWAENRIVCWEFNAMSDSRIKENITISDQRSDLDVLAKIEIVDYDYIDKVASGGARRKGVIAQSLSKLLPDAIHDQSEFVPDIYAKPSRQTLVDDVLTLYMNKAHGLESGDEVRIITPKGLGEHKVTIVDPQTFAIAGWEGGSDDLFVFGKRVDDFKVVDYNHLFALGLSATQELSKQVDALKAENAMLRDELAEIKAALKRLGA